MRRLDLVWSMRASASVGSGVRESGLKTVAISFRFCPVTITLKKLSPLHVCACMYVCLHVRVRVCTCMTSHIPLIPFSLRHSSVDKAHIEVSSINVPGLLYPVI